jgi:hypothetical protein
MRHLSDPELLLQAASEGSIESALHVAACDRCRNRQQVLERRLREASAAVQTAGPATVSAYRGAVWAAAATAAVLTIFFVSRPVAPASIPDPRFTPGSVDARVTGESVCSAMAESGAPIPPARAMAVFQRYSITRPEPRKYEVDYLIPPELGGTSDPDNLWPQPYTSGVWNARVKDALEDRLRAMVCNREMDLGTAQRELSHDWIEAYKKYFHTDRPLTDHAGFTKDRPWE